VTCSENDHLKVAGKNFEQLNSVGPDIDPCLNLFPSGELDSYFDVKGRVQRLIAMDQSLVQIENNGLLIYLIS